MRRYCSTYRLSCAVRRLTVVMGLVGFLVANTGLPAKGPVVGNERLLGVVDALVAISGAQLGSGAMNCRTRGLPRPT